jgi:hypothetical protein
MTVKPKGTGSRPSAVSQPGSRDRAGGVEAMRGAGRSQGVRVQIAREGLINIMLPSKDDV